MPVSALRAAAAESTALHYYDQAPSKQGHADDSEKEFLIDSISELSPEDRDGSVGLRAGDPAVAALAPGRGPGWRAATRNVVRRGGYSLAIARRMLSLAARLAGLMAVMTPPIAAAMTTMTRVR